MKTLSFVLVLGLFTTLAACGDKGEAPKPATSPSGSTAPANAPPPAAQKSGSGW